jgi:DNA replication and repair protein RecF
MLLERLHLDHYRNYARLEARFGEGVIVLQGANAQGKTNLLEAIYLLATTKSARARSDVDLISWGPPDPFSPTAFSRVAAHVTRVRGPVDVEILIQDLSDEYTSNGAVSALSAGAVDAEADGEAGGAVGAQRGGGRKRALPRGDGQSARKRFKINGVPRRAGEVLGQVNAVLFAPTDVAIVDGSPSARRRYLDVILCQAHPSYYRALQGYNKVLVQRNSLLRGIRDRVQPPEALSFWDSKLVEYGATVVARRAEALAYLATAAAEQHARVSGGRERLEVAYLSSTPLDSEGTGGVRAAFEGELAAQRARELGAGVSLVGPHRDDIGMAIGGVDVTSYGSRGQQRTVALALKLAELAYIKREAGEWPILLLDDATSELDAPRRAAVLALTRELPQVFLTTAEPDHLAGLLDGTHTTPQVWQVEGGALTPIN